MAEPRIVACPNCGKSVEWTPAAAWRPFCSERCKLIDLGAWASDRYRVSEDADKDQPDALDPDGPDAAPGAPKST